MEHRPTLINEKPLPNFSKSLEYLIVKEILPHKMGVLQNNLLSKVNPHAYAQLLLGGDLLRTPHAYRSSICG